MSNCGKCKSSKKEGLIGCEGSCNKWFHHTCVNFSETEFKLLEKCKNLFFICDVCKINCQMTEKSYLSNIEKNVSSINVQIAELNKNNGKQVTEMIEGFENLKNELTSAFQAQINELKLSIPKPEKTDDETTYAKALKQTSAIIFQPKDQSQSVSATKSDILRNVDPVKSGVSIRNTKNGHNGSLIVRCDKSEDTEKISKLANDNNLGEKYTIKQLPVINPRIRIVGITDEEITTENLSDYVIHQNRYFFIGEPYCKVIDKIVPLRKDKKRFQAIVEVNPATYDNMIKKGYLIVGYDDCLVYDAIYIKICYQCCGYHHYQKQCSQKLPRTWFIETEVKINSRLTFN
ncbi:hypothetical protein Zmor_026908 [Zophobas morio]|uniref:PHD-type domain-containing protein n=1 Tax=Zophobas morio TaxID=2755281 RepID=A0AA38M4X1_9CUCU|nr:hypothetical protein Zmor_026908 [Zophobas morio]